MKKMMAVLSLMPFASLAFASGGTPGNPYAFCYRAMLTSNGGLINAPKVPTDIAKGFTMQENGNLVTDPDSKGVMQVYTQKGLISISGISCSMQTGPDKSIDAKLGDMVKAQYQILQDLLNKAQAGNDRQATAQYSGTLKVMQNYCAFLHVLPQPNPPGPPDPGHPGGGTP